MSKLKSFFETLSKDADGKPRDPMFMIRFYINLIIPVVYLILGIFIIKEKIFIVKIEPAYAYSLGIILIVYGIFRLRRAFQLIKGKNDNEEN